MAVAVDTYDREFGIHPRYKQVIGERLATAGMAVAYGLDSFPSQGPIVTALDILGDGELQLTYDQDFTYDDSELTGFYHCCAPHPGVCRDMDSTSGWPPVEKDKVTASPSRHQVSLSLPHCEGSLSLAYLWRQTPIATPVWGAPIYAADKFRLPSPPWLWADIV